MGARQSYPRPPHVNVTEAQRAKMKEALEQMKRLG
jgi:hypothetical protein